jgi:hypothetical protein
MDERVKFIARFLEGETVASLVREFGMPPVARLSAAYAELALVF